MSDKKLWFKAKRYGWGWTPVSWEGWAVTIGSVAGICGGQLILKLWGLTPGYFLAASWALTLVGVASLIYVCRKKGEPPNWRSGK